MCDKTASNDGLPPIGAGSTAVIRPSRMQIKRWLNPIRAHLQDPRPNGNGVRVGECPSESSLGRGQDRADARHLHHHPLNSVEALARILGQELAGLVGEVEQDRARLDDRIRLSTGTLVIDVAVDAALV